MEMMMSSLNQFPYAPASREAFVEQEFHAGRDLRSGDTGAPSVTAAGVVGVLAAGRPFDMVRQGCGFRPPFPRSVSRYARSRDARRPRPLDDDA
jgi:hypothetical protein